MCWRARPTPSPVPPAPDDDYADPDGKKLTDGAYAEQFNTYSWDRGFGQGGHPRGGGL